MNECAQILRGPWLDAEERKADVYRVLGQVAYGVETGEVKLLTLEAVRKDGTVIRYQPSPASKSGAG